MLRVSTHPHCNGLNNCWNTCFSGCLHCILARRGELPARKLGRRWLVERWGSRDDRGEPAYRPAYRDAPYVPPAPVMPNFMTTNPFLDGWNQQDREMRERERHRMEMEMMRRRY